MKIFFKHLVFCIIFFVSGIAFSRLEVFVPVRHFLSSELRSWFIKREIDRPETIEKHYEIVMRTAFGQEPNAKTKMMLDKICALCTNSDATFEALFGACKNPGKELSQESVKQLQKYGFVDSTGKINCELEATKALQEIALQIQTESRLVKSQKIPDALALCDFFKVLSKSLSIKDLGSYQENLLNFKFNFSSYQTFLQLFAESFLEKDYYFETASKKPFIIDCGSNLGISILFFKTFYPDAEILAFEPSRICLPFLIKNISDNHLEDITVIDKAISNKKGLCAFHEVPSNTLEARLGGNFKDGCMINIESILLSEYIQKPVDFVKMDVEGAEVLIFEDLDQSKKISLIKEMAIECHGKQALEQVIKVLNKNDFFYQVKGEDLWTDAYLVHAINRITSA